MSRKILIVYNPQAGRKSHEIVLKAIKDNMPDELDPDYIDIRNFETTEHIYDYEIVVAVGGDGTVNTVASRLQYGSIPLGIIPAGSGDGLARHLGIKKDIKTALNVLVTGEAKQIDTGDLSGTFFINIAGTGFEAEVAHRFGKSSGRGFMGYFKTVSETFKSHPEREVELIIDGKKQPIKYFSLSIANGSQWGNNFRIASKADLQDHSFEIAVMRKPKWSQIPKLIRELLSQKQVDSSLITYYKASEVNISHAERVWHIDGEPIILTEKNRIACLPQSITVISPK
ncbi:hypothetical protein GYB22_02935 [bacterium]|nr:hypothetical protein [bacterium]